MSRREPSTYTFREFGMGLTAASSTRAVWARNFGLAFMALLSRTDRRGAKGPAVQRFPAAALSASGSKGLLSPGQASLLWSGPLRCSKGHYSKQWGFALLAIAVGNRIRE